MRILMVEDTEDLADAVALRFHQIERVGDDLRVLARPQTAEHRG